MPYERMQFRMTDVRKLLNYRDYVITDIKGITEAKLKNINGANYLVILYNGTNKYELYELEDYSVTKEKIQEINTLARVHANDERAIGVVENIDSIYTPTDEDQTHISYLEHKGYMVIKSRIFLLTKEILPNGYTHTVYKAFIPDTHDYVKGCYNDKM